MPANAQPTTATATPLFRVEWVAAAGVDFTIRSRFSARSSAVAVEFSITFLGEVGAAWIPPAASADPTSATIYKSRSKKRHAVAKKKSKFASLMRAIPAAVLVRRKARKPSPARPAGAVVVVSRGFFQVAQTCPACHGTGRIIEKPCHSCQGEGRVEKTSRVKIKIPAGIDSESRLRSNGGGEAGLRGGGSGDLYVVVHIKEHEVFTRNGMDLNCEVPIPFTTAALGGEIRVPTLNGAVSLKIPAGTQSGSTFRIRGLGMPAIQGTAKGDILTYVQVEVPSRLNGEQRGVLQKFAELCGEENNPINKSFYDRVKSFFK